MRWVFFLILAWVILIVQTTVGGLITFNIWWMGAVGADFFAPPAVFIALYARQKMDAMLAGCVLGFALDLGAAGGAESGAVVGIMPITYALAAWGVYSLRDAVFRDHALTRAHLTFLFCLLVHFAWVTLQSLLGGSWSNYWPMLAQVLGLAVYSALLSLGIMFLLEKGRRWIIRPSVGRSRQRR